MYKVSLIGIVLLAYNIVAGAMNFYKISEFENKSESEILQLGKDYILVDHQFLNNGLQLNSNTIYDIITNIDLDGKTIKIPDNCIIKFSGGCISNGTIIGDFTYIDAPLYRIFNNLQIRGSFTNKFYVEWFGASAKLDDNSNNLNYAIDQLHNLDYSGAVLVFTNTYKIQNTIYWSSRVSLEGVHRGGVMNTAVPTNKRSGSGLLFNFDDPNKWVIDSKLYDKQGMEYDIPYNQMFINTDEIGWGNNRKDGVYIRDLSIIIDENSPIDYTFGGMRLSQIYNSSIENVEICGVAFGMSLNGCWSCHITNLHIYAWYCALYAGHHVTTLTLRDSLFDKFYYNTNFTFRGDVLWLNEDTLFPPYSTIESSAIILEGVATDRTKIALDGVTMQYFDAVSCSSGNSKLILDKVYLEGIKKIISWTYNGSVIAKNSILPLLTQTENYTWGTYSGNIEVEGFPISTCAPTGAPYAQYIIRAFNERLLYYDSFEFENGDVVKMEYNDKKIFNRLDTSAMYIGGNAINESITDITYYHQLSTGFTPSQYTHFSEIIKRGYNGIRLVSNGGYTDISLGDEIIEGKKFEFSRFNNDAPYYLAYTSPIKIKGCEFEFKNQTFSTRKISFIDGKPFDGNMPDHVFDVYGTNVLKFDTYLEAVAEGLPLIKLSGDLPIDLTIFADVNYRTFHQFIMNPEYDTKYKVTIVYPDGRRRVYFNNTLPRKGMCVGDIINIAGKLYCYNGEEWVNI